MALSVSRNVRWTTFAPEITFVNPGDTLVTTDAGQPVTPPITPSVAPSDIGEFIIGESPIGGSQ